MKKRVIWKMFVLEVITLGIYRLYWLIKTRKEMMQSNPSIKIMSPWILILPMLIVIAGVIFFIGTIVAADINNPSCRQIYNSANSTSATSSSVDSCKPSSSAAIGMLAFYLAFFIAFFVYIVWIWSYSQAVSVITKEKLSFAISLLILIVVPDGIDILIVQDSFNKLAK